MDMIKYIGTMIGVVVLMGLFATYVSKLAENVHVVSPAPGISCAIVSRTFNTSIDCWKD